MTDHDLFAAIERRDLKAVSEMLRETDLRARLDLEARDEPRERYSMYDEATGIPKQGEI